MRFAIVEINSWSCDVKRITPGKKLCRSLRNLAIVNDGAILSFSGSQNDALDGSSRFFLATLRRDFVDLVRDSRFMRVSDARG